MSGEPIPMVHPEVDAGTFAVNEEQAAHLEGLGWQRTTDDDDALPAPLDLTLAAGGNTPTDATGTTNLADGDTPDGTTGEF